VVGRMVRHPVLGGITSGDGGTRGNGGASGVATVASEAAGKSKLK
jgi:hypothetical protein